MPLTSAAIIGGGQIIGGLLGGRSAAKAAQASADAQIRAAQIAADAARFRPVGITERWGSSNFGFDSQGNLISAGYTPSAELAGYQGFLSSQMPQTQQDVQGLLGLGRSYLAESPQDVREQYIAQQQALLAPLRERQLAGILNKEYQTGTGGLSIGSTGLRPGGGEGLRAANPRLEAYYNALAQQDLQLAAGAENAAQQRIGFGQGLLSSAYSPFQTNLGLQATTEELAKSPLTIGSNLGGRAVQGGAAAGQALLTGGLSAARTMQQANAYSPFSNAISGAFSNPQIQQALGKMFTTTPTVNTGDTSAFDYAYSGGGWY